VRFIGIDLGAKALHCVVLDESRAVIGGRLLSPNVSEVKALTDGATAIAIDAPSSHSTGPHRDDETLAAKFRLARCSEIALGREVGIWVPWVTPVATAVTPAWMEVGFRLYNALLAAGHRPIEVYPYAGFRVLAAAHLPPKTTAAGLRERVDLLRREHIAADHMELWSHDAVDAALGALVAVQAHEGSARPVGCGHDRSAIWLPHGTQVRQ
jgi:predicted nuclease with RNAse H fold